jgi:hypothetical protein
VVGDYNDDGWPDVFVANDSVPNYLFENDGRGSFREVGLIAGVAVASDGKARAGMGTDFGDYDGDGLLDLVVTNHEFETNSLFRNLGGRRFAEVSRQSGPGFAVDRVGRALDAGDIDNDGDLDLLAVNNNGPVDLLRNGGIAGATAVVVRLVGTASNRSAVGARLRATVGAATQLREVKAGSSYLAQNDLRVHFGLGAAKQIDRLEIRWPNGKAPEVLTGVPAGQIVTVTEGKGITARVPFARR